MSYRVDIPTLSANEVYTLTFEYEGTETIQLIVGDLTLETTDRRVVFTTTSPVNYIESNVNLTNLNLYEGYYESDDFGGEYTQESYIEGKSLVNLCEIKFIGDTSSWKYQMTGYDEEGYMHIIPRLSGHTNYYKVYPKDQPWKTKYGTYTLVIDFTSFLPDKTVDTCWESSSNTGNSQQKYKDFTYNGGQSRKFVVTFITSETQNYYMELNLGDLDLTTNTSGEIIVSYMVVEGDYFDEFCKEEKTKSWVGIGCVKSPKIISREQPLNMFYCTNWTSTLNNGTVTCQDGKFYFDGSFGGYTYFDIINGGEVKNNIYLEPGSYYAKMKAYSKEPCVVSGTCVSLEATMENGITLDLCSVYTSKDKMYNQVTGVNKQFTSPIVKLILKIWYGGNGSNNIIIDGVYFSKTNTTDDLAFKENHAITTPDDLELYSLPDGTCDTLDLTTGVVTRNTEFYKYTGTWGSAEECTVSGYDDGNWWLTMISTGFGTSKDTMILLHGIVFYQFIGITRQTHLLVPKSLVPNASDMITWLRNNIFALLKKQTPTTEQLSLNPLKSYKNGSIQTSSQQLTPTLKTTLPISNKFTTTNLTSGSTYNIYFDGIATKLDAGGTIIANPVSPCKVECGGTTLTIEGTDIQNVRVIETSVKNEVGNNGTSDVELSKIESFDVNGENIITFNLKQPIKLRSLGTTYDSYNPVTGELTKRIGISETDGSYSVLSSPVTSQVEIDNIPQVYKNGIIKIYSDSNIYPIMTLEIPTTNKYNTSTWETGVYTQRNIVEIYFNDSTTPMIPTETLTLTENHLLSGHMIIIGENPMLIKGNYTGRDIPYFTGMRSVEAIEVETTPSPDQPLFGKGGRK